MAMCLAAFAGSVGCRLFEPASSTTDSAAPLLPGQSTGVFTTARPTLAGALNDFFGRRPIADQPLEFPHNVHVGKQIMCTEYCHESVTKGPVAGLPSVSTCMICHAAIATDRPRIQQLAALSEKGLDLQWARVYGYATEARVKFNHAPHIRAKVECATCHGDVGEQTVAQRNVDLNMGFCVNCHNANNASVDCLACHF
ncbi:MAG: cytochrome c3 family protein [Acidobacteria bacterium]|nr:cytochrome c3 family protein [Acidobacteriota bacterium]